MFIRQNVYHEGDRYFFRTNEVTAQTQHGQTCKLNALSTAINAMSTRLGLSKPLPVRGHSRTTSSIRQLAKAKYHSVVGEIYSPIPLRSIAINLGYPNSTIHGIRSFDDYSQVMIAAVNKGEAPIVFFDVSDDG